MLTRNITTVKDIPGEPGQTMTLRQLGWRQLMEATEAKSTASLHAFKGMGEVLAAIQSTARSDVQQAAADAPVDPLAKYDQATILLYGIAAWSYPEKVTGENIGLLDEATALWAATEIVNMGKPPADKDIEDRFFGSQDSSMATPATATVAMTAGLTSHPNGSSL